MHDIASLVTSLGGIAQKQQLVCRGAGDLDLTRAVRNGDVFRARQGWYSTLPPMDPRVQAVRVGGRLTGISAVEAADGWVLRRHPLHVSLHENAARLRSRVNRRVGFDGRRDDTVLHWDDPAVASRGTNWSVDIRDALYRVVVDEPFEQAVAALDWALNTGRIDPMDLEELIFALPADLRGIRRWMDEKCESLPESLSRTRIRLRGHRVESQRRLGDLEHIDLVVDDCVGVETDGDRWHRDRFEEDRSKDLDITITGLHCIRPSARTVFDDWDRVLLAVETAVATHVDAPSRVFGNSGLGLRRTVKLPGAARLRRIQRRRSPEFPRGSAGSGQRGNTDAAGTLQST
ncbi:MAG: glycyl-tRNA synthetase [Actinomycetota bacterium]